MQARNNARLRTAGISAVLSAAHSDTFGGAWMDQAAGGVIVIASTVRSSINLGAVLRMLPNGAKAGVRRVMVSYAFLNQPADKPSRPKHSTRPLTRPDITYPDEPTKVWADPITKEGRGTGSRRSGTRSGRQDRPFPVVG